MNNVRMMMLVTMMLMSTSARAEVITAATLLSDTFIANSAPSTNYATDSFLALRSVSAASRGAFVQFQIPAMNPALITNATFTLRAAATGSSFPNVDVLATTNAVNLSTLTWDSAVSSGLLTGTGREADFTLAWGNAWTQFAGPLVLGSVSAVDPIGGTIIPYQSAGLTDYLKSQANSDQAVVVTLAMGFAAAETTTGGMQFRAIDNQSGIYAPTLQIQAVPEPSLGMLVLISALAAGWRRSLARRQ